MTKYKMANDVLVKINGTDLELQRGVLNFHNLVIDIKESSKELIHALNALATGNIYETEKYEIKRDLDTLSSFGYLNVIHELIKPEKILLVVDEDEYEVYKNSKMKVGKLITSKELIHDKEEESINNIQDSVQRKNKLEEIVTRYSLRNYKHIIWIDTYYDVRRIRIFNMLLKYLEISGTFAISDINFFFITTVQHGTTGCFECLENQIKTRIANIEILNQPMERNMTIEYGHITLKLGFVSLIIDEIIKEGITNTLGNVIEFDTQTKEYFFDSNRIQSSCSICATQNNVFHEEEIVKTVDILNQLKENRYEDSK
ncbi:hypothetical protein [Limosilactobacillus allomucosae]|uniref:Bacteriocin biosynthesis cyclodehydratase domain-containing protein n=1 Tax=Limosilactobacillus allomucosae TaxID=3142938 RepID=A0ABV0I527_9LACO